MPKVIDKCKGSTNKYGFLWGPLLVTREAQDEHGVYLALETKRYRLEVRVTPSGFIRLGKLSKRTNYLTRVAELEKEGE